MPSSDCVSLNPTDFSLSYGGTYCLETDLQYKAKAKLTDEFLLSNPFSVEVKMYNCTPELEFLNILEDYKRVLFDTDLPSING